MLKMLLLWAALLGQGDPQEVDVPVTEPVKIDKVAPLFIYPKIPVPEPGVKNPVTPADQVDSKTPFPLKHGELFVIQSNTKFLKAASPEGLVTLKPMKSPLNAYGVFAGGTGKEEEREFTQPFIVIVKAMEGKKGRVELLLYPDGAVNDEEIVRILIDIGVAPQPPPDDQPDVPEPDDKPDIPEPSDPTKAMVEAITQRYANLPADEAAKVAASFREVSAKITAGSITDLPQLTKVTSDLIWEKIGFDAALKWMPWKKDISTALDTQGLKDVKDYAKPWITIADVLEKK